MASELMTSRNAFGWVRLVAFNLALLLLLTELLALASYFLRTGKLYYLSPPSGRSVPVDLTGGVEKFRLHPYFGFVNRPGLAELQTNNYGFVSQHDYPYERRDGEYLVGVFGGSVAAGFARFEAEHRALAPLLAQALGIEPAEVSVLNFAQGGFKQPQQLLVYTYFRSLGQELDLVINIDGFNEIALAGRNVRSQVALEMPSFDHLRALREVTGQVAALDDVEKMLEIRSSWKKFARTFNRAWSGESWELTTASGFLADFLIYKYHLWRYRTHLEARVEATGVAPEDSWLVLERPREQGPQVYGRAVALWARSSELLDGAQKNTGGAYLHLVQPNQYHPTQRRFSDEEKEVAFSPESPFADYVRQGYPRLAAEVESLSGRGVRVFSLLELFDDVYMPVYEDDCCHYNETGQRLLAEAIAEALED